MVFKCGCYIRIVFEIQTQGMCDQGVLIGYVRGGMQAYGILISPRPHVILGVASPLETLGSSWIRTMDSTGALFPLSGRLHWILALLCPAVSDESGSLCLITRDSLTSESISEDWRPSAFPPSRSFHVSLL